ncbi:MAG: glucose-6-phosphate dehydrogenase [Caldilineaceae bacterium]|nr:glucose-6-phosphate dehydrogenase [Caldilineaceae bacterium]
MNDRKAEPALMVVFGASGDLAKRKLIPALYTLYTQGLLDKDFTLVGYARTEYTDEEFRQLAHDGVVEYSSAAPDGDVWQDFAQCLFYQTGGYDSEEAFQELKARLDALEEDRNREGNRLFYLSTPPSVFEPVTTLINTTGLKESEKGGWVRLIIEKPFGHDLASAQKLNEHLRCHFSEDQIYRIDHYLGKETVQNMMVFRFGNGIFEPIWNRNYVDHVQITVAESLGIGDRGGYYDRSGAIRDMMQNHVMQLVALTAMEPPVAFDAKAVRDQKVNVLRSIKPLAPEDVHRAVVRAQYGPGMLNGEEIPGYLETPGVAPDSTTETYVAWRLEIDNWRWNGVPFFLRTGKALAKKVTEVNIVFQRPPLMFFSDVDGDQYLHRNVLTLRIQPDEGIHLSFDAKKPGPVIDVDLVSMNFNYSDSFGAKPADAYERLLLDAMLGDGTLFIRGDEIEVAWDRVTRVLEGWKLEEETASARVGGLQLPTYEPGSWGPLEADELIRRDGHSWRNMDTLNGGA